MNFEQDWREVFVDRMGLIVALSGAERFRRLAELKVELGRLPEAERVEVREILRQRFTPSGGRDGCQSAMAAVEEVR